LARSQLKKRQPTVRLHFVRHLIEITSRQPQTRRTLLDWLRVECRRRKKEERRIQKAKAAVIFTVQSNRDELVVKSLERRVPDGR
jgi:hypothetical protein